MEKVNLLNFCYPGIYEIFCKQTQRSYFGQSENVMYRLGRHYNDLEKNVHEISALQNDWLQYGAKSFVFQALDFGPQWDDFQARLIREVELIETCEHQVYNVKKPVISNFRKEWTIQGTT